jgi:hypothetical protein
MSASAVARSLTGTSETPMRGSGLLGLRVVVVPDGEAWFAQGLDVDFFAQGATPQEAEKNFAEGLQTMIKLYLAEFKSLQHLNPPPKSVSGEYAKMRFGRVEQCPLRSVGSSKVPYRTIQFFVAES